MALAWEKVTSGEVVKGNRNEDCSFSTSWVIQDASSELEAISEVENRAPIALEIGSALLIRGKISVSPIANKLWDGTVEYSPEGDPDSRKEFEPGEWTFSADTTGATTKVTRSLQELKKQWAYSAGMSPPNIGGAIGFDGRRVTGIDIVIPKLEFEINAYYNPSQISMKFVKNLARATGKMNSDAWLSFDPGELLFMGGRVQGPIPTVRGARVKPISVAFKFAASENRFDIIVGDNPDPLTKLGWDYLDVRFAVVDEGGMAFPRPIHARIHRVYPVLSFTAFFGFGGA